MELGIAGKRTLVVGASKGIGRAAATGFASEGAWDPSEIGEQIRKSMAEWPKAANVPELIF